MTKTQGEAWPKENPTFLDAVKWLMKQGAISGIGDRSPTGVAIAELMIEQLKLPHKVSSITRPATAGEGRPRKRHWHEMVKPDEAESGPSQPETHDWHGRTPDGKWHGCEAHPVELSQPAPASPSAAFEEWWERSPCFNTKYLTAMAAWSAALLSATPPAEHYILFATAEDAQNASTILAKAEQPSAAHDAQVRALIVKWRAEAKKNADEQVDLNARLHRGETVTIESVAWPIVYSGNRYADELESALKNSAPASAAKDGDACVRTGIASE
jgi:hypothetical protein